jgi:hypothetical protein
MVDDSRPLLLDVHRLSEWSDEDVEAWAAQAGASHSGLTNLKMNGLSGKGLNYLCGFLAKPNVQEPGRSSFLKSALEQYELKVDDVFVISGALESLVVERGQKVRKSGKQSRTAKQKRGTSDYTANPLMDDLSQDLSRCSSSSSSSFTKGRLESEGGAEEFFSNPALACLELEREEGKKDARLQKPRWSVVEMQRPIAQPKSEEGFLGTLLAFIGSWGKHFQLGLLVWLFAFAFETLCWLVSNLILLDSSSRTFCNFYPTTYQGRGSDELKQTRNETVDNFNVYTKVAWQPFSILLIVLMPWTMMIVTDNYLNGDKVKRWTAAAGILLCTCFATLNSLPSTEANAFVW